MVEPTRRELESALEKLVFFVEWHMPYKGAHHPTYAAPVQEAHRVLKLCRASRDSVPETE